MEQLFEGLGTILLVSGIVVVFYAFYRVLKSGLSAIKDNDD